MSAGQMHYNVVDTQTNEIVAAASTIEAASKIANIMNSEHGAQRYCAPTEYFCAICGKSGPEHGYYSVSDSSTHKFACA